MGAGTCCRSAWVTSRGTELLRLTAASLTSCSGETIKIVIEDYVQHLSGYFLSLKFDPELLFGTQFQYRNRIAVEFNQLYHWHGLMPDSFIIQGEEYSYEQFLYNTSMLIDYGVEALVESFSKQIAGRVRSCLPLPAGTRAAGPREGSSWCHEGRRCCAVRWWSPALGLAGWQRGFELLFHHAKLQSKASPVPAVPGAPL